LRGSPTGAKKTSGATRLNLEGRGVVENKWKSLIWETKSREPTHERCYREQKKGTLRNRVKDLPSSFVERKIIRDRGAGGWYSGKTDWASNDGLLKRRSSTEGLLRVRGRGGTVHRTRVVGKGNRGDKRYYNIGGQGSPPKRGFRIP